MGFFIQVWNVDYCCNWHCCETRAGPIIWQRNAITSSGRCLGDSNNSLQLFCWSAPAILSLAFPVAPNMAWCLKWCSDITGIEMQFKCRFSWLLHMEWESCTSPQTTKCLGPVLCETLFSYRSHFLRLKGACFTFLIDARQIIYLSCEAFSPPGTHSLNNLGTSQGL